MGECASLTQGFLAFNIADLVPNGFINEVGTDRRGNSVRLLPSNRLTVELQYSVTANTGTTLNDIAGGVGVGGIFGSLGAGAGFGIGQVIGTSLQGDFEPTKSQFVFHVCDAKTFLNKEIELTQEQIDSGIIEMPHYLIGVMGVTRNPIEFTEEQLESLGRSGNPERGAKPSPEGLITNEVPVTDNLFLEIVRDERKYLYRADNQDGTNCFVSGSQDDLVDKKIRFTSQFESEELEFKPGDKVYVTYLGVLNNIVRHAIYTVSSFFLFPGPFVERIGEDRVRSWHFKPFEFRAHKNALLGDRATVDLMEKDDEIDQEINSKLEEEDISEEEVADLEEERNRKKKLSTLEGQRLTEAFWDNTVGVPYIRGFYVADRRGIFRVSNELAYDAELIISAEDIRDQEWWNDFITSFLESTFGLVDGQFDFGEVNSLSGALQKGFLFDISDHVNACVYDNEKYGYQRDLAEALTRVSSFDPADPESGIGVSNFDLELNSVPGRESYDASTARFSAVKMSSTVGGAYFIRDCNVFFNQENLFNQGNSFLQADMFIRTPVFFSKLTDKSRIYVERFSPQLGLSPDGGIWVTTNPISGDNMSSDIHPNNKVSALVFADATNSSLQYHMFDEGVFRIQIEGLQENPRRVHAKESAVDIVPSDIRGLGYDKILGNEPGYSNGLEITTELGRVNRGLLSFSDVYKEQNLTFQRNSTDDTVTVTGLAEKRIKQISINYQVLPQSTEPNDMSLLFIFPNADQAIDNLQVDANTPEGSTSLLVVHCPYYRDSQLIIKGDGLKLITILSITMLYLEDSVYEKNKVSTSNVSTIFDSSGNWYVFYEDNQVADDLLTSNEEVIGDPGNSLLQSSFTEISCLISYDQGLTWYDHKGVVRTAGDESIKNPYAIVDRENDFIHLFYVIEDTLCHKGFSAKIFDSVDSFTKFNRPERVSAITPDNFGLENFTENGKALRLIPSNIVIGNNESEFLSTQLPISQDRISAGLAPRFVISSTRCTTNNDLVEDFTSSSYVCSLDRQGFLRVYYTFGTKLFIRQSSDNGLSWTSLHAEGIDFHKHSDIHSPEDISHLGVIYNESNSSINVAYIADGMLFVREIAVSSFNLSGDDLISTISAESETAISVFVVGSLSQPFKQSIQNGTSKAKFSYPIEQIPLFNEDMSIQDTPPRGYVGASGYNRYFYKDVNGNIRAFTFQSATPILDTRLVNG